MSNLLGINPASIYAENVTSRNCHIHISGLVWSDCKSIRRFYDATGRCDASQMAFGKPLSLSATIVGPQCGQVGSALDAEARHFFAEGAAGDLQGVGGCGDGVVV